MIVHVAADHAGFELKENVKSWLQDNGYEVKDHGAYEFNKDDDFVDFIFPAAHAVSDDNDSRGILIGGSGQGEAIAANRVKGVRAVVYYGPALPITAVDASGRMSDDPYEIIRLSRTHNNSNILSVGGRFVSFDELKKVAKMWLDEPTSDLERYQSRNRKLDI